MPWQLPLTEIIPSATGYFCISAVSEYSTDSGLKQLREVYAEAETVRSALRDLGLNELFRPDQGERTHEELRARLVTWAQVKFEDELPERDKTLVIYCTGHGYLDETGQWYLVPPDCHPVDPKRYTRPSELLRIVYSRRDLAQVVLVLDACFAGDGADQAFNETVNPVRAQDADLEVDIWVIAAARRTEEAAPVTFAPALARALEVTASPSWQQAFLRLDEIEQEVANRLERTTQHAKIVTVHDAAGCRALPNPGFMPPVPPAWLAAPWDAAARGVRSGGEPGWFFLPREPAWSALLDFVTDRSGDPTVCVVRGSRGCGKTALLARLVTSATASLREGMPAVTRRGRLPDTDLAVAAVDARALSVADIARELARLIGASAHSPADLLSALANSRQAVIVIIDNLEAVTDPDRLAAELIEPLRRVPMVRLVTGSRFTELVDPRNCHVIDLDDPAQGGASAVEHYLAMRLTYGSPQEFGSLAGAFAAAGPLARACAGNFSAAVVAIETMAARGRDRRPVREALAAAVEAVAKRLDSLCRQALRDEFRVRASASSPEASADALASTLSALCSYAEDAALPLSTWVQVAERVSGKRLLLADAEACARRAVPFLSISQEGNVTRCRPRYGHAPGLRDPVAADVVRHLLAVVGPRSAIGWRDVDPAVMAILAGATEDPAAGTSQLLDEAGFLLAASPSLVVRTLKTITDKRDRARRADVWFEVPASGAYHARSLILGLRASQAGLARLAATCEPGLATDGSARVRWACRYPERCEYPAIGLAIASGDGVATALTAASDGALTWWSTTSGERVSVLPPAGDGSVIKEVHAAMVDGVPQAVTVSADGGVRRWRGDTGPVALAGLQARMAACHQDGLLAVSGYRSIRVLAADDSVVASLLLPSGPVYAISFAGPPGEPVLWIVSADGAVRRWEPCRSAKAAMVAVCPAPIALAGSDDGGAVVVDAKGQPTFPGRTVAAPAFPPPGTPRTGCVHLSRRWLVMVGGQVEGGKQTGWMQTCDLATGRSTLRPLDDPPVAVSGFGNDGDLLLMTRQRIAAIRLTPRPAEELPPGEGPEGDS